MVASTFAALSGRLSQVRAFFVDRELMFHDGRALRRLSLSARTQMMAAGACAVTLMFSAYGVASAGAGAIAATGIAGGASDAKVVQMRAQMHALKADIAEMKVATRTQAARVEQRQALLAAVLSGKGDPEELAAQIPMVPVTSGVATAAVAPLVQIEARQGALAAQAQKATEMRLAMTASHLRRLGMSPERIIRRAHGGMGGPFEAAPNGAEASANAAADAQFRTLFQTWKKLDTLEQAVIAIPSLQPVDNLTFTSNFGVRSDPFRGVAAMHAGVDIPGPMGTPVYATADGMIARAERAGAYGNLVEVNHGKGIETRYGHLSRILVSANTKVKRGQLIGLMGSTGRSTGSHLHYEVRVDGRAVNPVPYLQTAGTMLAIQDKSLKAHNIAVGGPAANR